MPDLNRRPHGPQPCALPTAPIPVIIFYVLRSRSAPTFCRPGIDLLEASFKSVKCPCDEPLAHLTRNFIFENKFSREDFLANCHRQFSPQPRALPTKLHPEVIEDKPTVFLIAQAKWNTYCLAALFP